MSENTLEKLPENLIIQKNEVPFFEQVSYDFQKKYLLDANYKIAPLENLELCPIKNPDSIEDIAVGIRFLPLTKFVYEKDIKISYKLKSVYTALHSLKSSYILKLSSDGITCNIYVGIKSNTQTTNKAEILKGAIEGNFPGTQFGMDEAFLKNKEVIELNEKSFKKCKEITAVVGIPSLKDKEEEEFIQGIENVIMGMNGKPFSALFIADAIDSQDVETTLNAYKMIYSILSSDKEFVETHGENTSKTESVSNSTSTSISESDSNTEGKNDTTNFSSTPWIGKAFWRKIVGSKKVLAGKSSGTNSSTTTSTSQSTSESQSQSNSTSQGTNSSRQLTYTNKLVSSFLDQLDKQIERLEQGKGVGFWNVGAYFISDDFQNSQLAANIYNGVIKGQESNFECSVVKTFDNSNESEKTTITDYLKRYEIPRLDNGGFLAQAVTTDELTVQINFPQKSVVGLDVVQIVPFGNNPKRTESNHIKIGKHYNYEQLLASEITLDYNKLTSHVFVTGSTGSGKSNVTYNLIDKLTKKGISFLVLEPAKGEYKDEFGNRDNVSVYGTNPQFTPLLKINPFEFPDNIHIYEHIDRFIEILNACWPMEAAMPNLLKSAVEDAYVSKGWILEESRSIYPEKKYPLFIDLLISLKMVINESSFSSEVKSNYEGALVSRVQSMTNGLNKLIFGAETLSDEELFDKNVVIDLSRVASSESKALFMGLVFMKLNEYRIANKSESNSNLKHVTIIEEAHNLLKRTSSDQSQDSANLAGKSVEMISNAIAEMRTYGEGFIIADQAPGLLDMSVIRNTNTKICLRLPDFEDRKLVGQAMNLDEDQIKQLASLETGVAAIYQNDWQEAVLCKFDKYSASDSSFTFKTMVSTKRKIDEVINLIKNKKENLTSNEILKIQEIIHLDFMINQIKGFDFSKSANLVKNNLLKLITQTCEVEIEEANFLLKNFILPLVVSFGDTNKEQDNLLINKLIKINKIL